MRSDRCDGIILQFRDANGLETARRNREVKLISLLHAREYDIEPYCGSALVENSWLHPYEESGPTGFPSIVPGAKNGIVCRNAHGFVCHSERLLGHMVSKKLAVKGCRLSFAFKTWIIAVLIILISSSKGFFPTPYNFFFLERYYALLW